MPGKFSRYCVTALLIMAYTVCNAIPPRPVPPRLVNDFAGIFTARETLHLEQMLTAFDDSTSNQIAVITTTDLEGLTPAEYATRTGLEWGIGSEKYDNGIVVLVKPKTYSSNGQVNISVGYGLEGAIPDAYAKRIIDNEMMTALCLASKKGVDVRVITPGIPDKKMVFLLTQSYYEQLISAGVRIYEYTPGFIHAKNFVCDDEFAAVGTINLDYRSLYLHFECGVWLYRCQAVGQVKEDMLRTFEISEEITLDWCLKQNVVRRAGQSILRLFAPML